VRKILATGAPVAYPTHFGAVHDVPGASRQMLEELEFSHGLLNEAVASDKPDAELEVFCEQRFHDHFKDLDEGERQLLELDLKLNAAGIAHVAKKLREKRRGKSQ
jgi:hypothetical protein